MMCPSLTEKKILLGSTSPRRQELLSLIVPDFIRIKPKDVEETYPLDLRPEKIPVFLSSLKAEAYSGSLHSGEILITADTIVINDNDILGKPVDENEAVRMLSTLSGKTHRVVTGVTLSSSEKKESFSEMTEVTFGDLNEKDIRDYVKTFRPMDKAGAYGIQEWIGCTGIRGIRGCYYNVMGLPLYALASRLRQF